MSKFFALCLVALAALAGAASAQGSTPQQPSIADTFTAYVNTTMPFFGTVPAKMYYDVTASAMRFDFVTWGTTSYLIQRYDLAKEYNIVPDSEECDVSDLDPTMPSLAMPPGCTFVRNTTFEGVKVQEWHAEIWGMGATWLVQVLDDKHAHLVRYQTTGLPINLDLVVDLGTVDESPIPFSTFDITPFPYCKKPPPPEKYTVAGYVMDASTGRLITSAVEVTLEGADDPATSNTFKFEGVEAGEHTISVTADGYAGAKRRLNVTRDIQAGTVADFALSKLLPSDSWYRFVLTWGANPRDLDSYLYTPGCTVYYRNRACGHSTLDHDDTSSYGPETITTDSSEHNSGIYKHEVRVFTSGANFRGSGATVTVYRGKSSDPVQVLTIDPASAGTVWETFQIENGDLTVVNQVK